MPADTAAASAPGILLVDDDPQFLLSAGLTLRTAGLGPVVTLADSRQVVPFLTETRVAAVVLDLVMPHLSGTDLLPRLREEFPQVPVLVLSGRNEVETAVACMRAGACDYLVKPIENSRFVSSLARTLELSALREEMSSLKARLLSGRLKNPEAFAGMITDSRAMLAVFQYVEVVAPLDQPVLITGETGTGKELVARAVHDLSGRKGPFLPVNVAGLDDAMFSDTLFGHRKGAYTGADQVREGLIAQAGSGTLFLDEIGDLKESSQVKLLRLLEERTYYPLGSDVSRPSRARIVCATHRNLKEVMASGSFRKDLYYRLSAHHVHLPPLRERLEDVPLLLAHFLEEVARDQRREVPAVPAELATLLSAYHFPGNVRELRAMVFDAMVQHKGGILSTDSFRKSLSREREEGAPGSVPSAPGDAPVAIGVRFPTLKETERFLVAEALRRARNNQGVAATLLGITRQALNKRLIRDAATRKPSS